MREIMKISDVLKIPSIRVLLYVHDKQDVRYSDLAKLIKSRGTLATLLKELESEGLMERKVITAKPIETHYTLTPLGRKVGQNLKNINSLFS